MRKSKYSEHQIIAILKAVEAGRTVKDVCREHELSEATYYKWKAKYGGMEAADIKRLRELEEENRRLKHMYAELSLDHQILKELLTKKL
jgi:putative transposase